MSKKIEMGKQYHTRDGREVRILCVDRDHQDYPVVALIGDGIESFTAVGSYRAHSEDDSELDLIEYNPANDLKIDQAIWVRDSNDELWVSRHFKRVASNGNVECWANGLTSHTADHEDDDYTQWREWSATNPNK